MAVKTTSAKCDVPVVDASPEIGDGNSVQIAKYLKLRGQNQIPKLLLIRDELQHFTFD